MSLAPEAGLGLRIDTARPRVVRTAIRTAVDGTAWDLSASSNLLVDPITGTAMIAPYQMQPGWDNTPLDASNNYKRLGIADYRTQAGAALSADTWIENHRDVAGNIYLENLGVNQVVYTSASWLQNRPFYLRLFIPAGANAQTTAVEIGWGEVNAIGSVGLKIYGSGKVEVYKSLTGIGTSPRVGTYSIGTVPDATKARNPDALAPSTAAAGKLITLYLIPCRQRELLVLTSEGGGFSHTFTDLNFSPTGQQVAQQITPVGRFWWHVVSGKASVQCAPLRFPTQCDALRRVDELRRLPPAGAQFEIADAWDVPGYGNGTDIQYSLRNGDNPANAVVWPTSKVRLRARLFGDGTNTPFLYAADARLSPGVASTNGTQAKQIDDWCVEYDFTVGEDASGTSATATLKLTHGDDKTELPIPGVEFQYNRPALVEIDRQPFLVGTTGEPEIVEGKTEAVRINLPIRDLWAQLEAARFEDDQSAYDGFLLTDAIHDLLTLAGIPLNERDIEPSTFPIDYAATCATGEWSWQPKAGETVAEWLSKLHKTFAPTWDMGFVPFLTGPKFRFRSEATLYTAPAATIYMDRAGDAERKACYRFSEKTLPPEATRISVYGFDPASRTFLTASWIDTMLEDPTVLPTARPDGWHGEVSPLVLVEPRLTTAAGVLKARDQLVQNVGTVLRLAEWECGLLQGANGLPLWRGDVVRIHPYGDYRIKSFRGRMRRAIGITDGGTDIARRTSYVGKWIGPIPS